MNRVSGVTYNAGAADSFHYYLDGELNTATVGYTSHSLTYNFDNKGNRTSVTDTANPTVTYTPNPIDQYTAVSGSSITNGPEHEIQTFNGVAYSYVNDERLHSATSGSTIYSMVYDALGRCVMRTLQNPQDNPRPTPTPRATPTPPQSPTPSPTPGGGTTYYIYDGEKPILEYDATSGASVGVNLYGKGIDEIVERVAVGADGQTYIYYPQQNHEGSVTLLTDGSGAAIERYRYDAFGAPTFYDGNWNPQFGAATFYDNRFLFTGREYAATYRSFYTTPGFNFYEYRARAYNPTLGRFMSEDPKLFVRRNGLQKLTADSAAAALSGVTGPNRSAEEWSFTNHPDEAEFNLFRYCGNDPIDFIDPMGLFEWAFSEDFPHTGPGVVSGRETVQRAINIMDATKKGSELQAMDRGRTIVITPATGKQQTGVKGNILYVNPKDPLFLDRQSRNDFSRHVEELPPTNDKGRAVIIGHEVGHAVTPGMAGRDENHYGGHNVRDNENPIRRQLQIPERQSYGGTPIDRRQ